MLARNVFFFGFCPRWCLVRVRVKDRRGETKVSQWTLGEGGRRGTQGTFPNPSRDGGEGGEEVLLCHREAFFPRQRGCDTPDTVYHLRGDWQGRR